VKIVTLGLAESPRSTILERCAVPDARLPAQNEVVRPRAKEFWAKISFKIKKFRRRFFGAEQRRFDLRTMSDSIASTSKLPRSKPRLNKKSDSSSLLSNSNKTLPQQDDVG
jgi:hypothetical protein